MGTMELPWRDQVREYFFHSHLSVEETAILTGVSRKSISGYLRGLPEYEEERKHRKAVNKAKRQEYKNRKNREYRAEAGTVTQETMRQEHDMAALILSREKYY